MRGREQKRKPPDSALEIRLAEQTILRESLGEKNARIKTLTDRVEERNARIRVLEEEIRALRGVVSTIHLDPRFWIGFPIGLSDEPWNCQNPERRKNCR